MSERDYRPRWIVALLLLTMPIWFVPGLIAIGWQRTGMDTLRQIKPGILWAVLGRKL